MDARDQTPLRRKTTLDARERRFVSEQHEADETIAAVVRERSLFDVRSRKNLGWHHAVFNIPKRTPRNPKFKVVAVLQRFLRF
jgi:hypothetical protein